MNQENENWNLSRMIKRLDIFGHKQTFRINNKSEHRSVCGGIVSVVFIICALIFIAINFIYFITRSNVSLIFTHKILDKNPFVNLTQLQFNFAFTILYERNSSDALQEVAKDFLDINLELIQWEGEGVHDINKTNIPLKPCTEADFYNVKPDIFRLNEIDKMLCPNLTKEANFSLSGLYTDDWFQYLELSITIKPQWLQKYKSLISFSEAYPLIAAFFFLDTGIDYESLDDPLPDSINYYYTSMNLNTYKISEMFLSPIEFSSDENFLITKSTKYRDIILDRAQEYSFQINDRTSPNLPYPLNAMKFLIKASSKQYIVNRTYQKITAFLAEMSGLISQILIVLIVILGFINKKFSENKIMAQVLKYKGKKNYDIKYLSEIFTSQKMNDFRLSVKRGSLENQIEKSMKHLNFMEDSSKNSNEDILSNNEDVKEVEIYYNYENFKDSKYGTFLNNNINLEQNSDKLTLNSANKQINQNNELNSKKNIPNTARGSEVSSFYPKIEDYSQISGIKPAGSIYSKESNSNEMQEIEVCSNKDLISKRQENSENKRKKLARQNLENEIKKRMSKNTTVHPVDSYVRKRDLEVSHQIDRFFKLNTFEIFLIRARCCCKKYRIRSKILRAGHEKMFYYLDVFTYVKKMQEIDIIKYLLFSADQLCLFNFLSKPPVSTNDITSQVYKEFELEQKKITSLTKDEVNQLHECYVNILNQNKLSHNDKKLLNLIDAEIECIKD